MKKIIGYDIKSINKSKRGGRKVKGNEKKMIAILVAITVVVIIIAIMMNFNKSKEEETENEAGQEENTVSLLEDGTLLNNSDKLHETKRFEEMEMNQIQLTERDGETELIATVTNTSDTDQGDYPVLVKMLDQQGNEITTMNAYIGKLKAGKSTKISTSATFDSTNVYDFTITKK